MKEAGMPDLDSCCCEVFERGYSCAVIRVKASTRESGRALGQLKIAKDFSKSGVNLLLVLTISTS